MTGSMTMPLTSVPSTIKIHDKNATHDALLRNPTSRTLHERFSSKRATVQRQLRSMENNWWAGMRLRYRAMPI